MLEFPFSQIIPPSHSPSESKSPVYTSVSFFLSCIQGRHCHLPKDMSSSLVVIVSMILQFIPSMTNLASLLGMGLTPQRLGDGLAQATQGVLVTFSVLLSLHRR